MSYSNHPQIGRVLQVRRLPWLMFLFLAAVFFMMNHDLSYSKKRIDNFNPSEDAIITGVTEGSLARRIALLSLGLVAIVNLVRHPANGRVRINSPLGWVLLGFAAWALLSVIWADDIALTFRRLVVFGILCIAAVAVLRRLLLRELILWIFFSTALFLAIGILAELFLGTFRPFASGYRFAGTLHPNGQGINCALLLLSGVAVADTEKHRRILFRACALLGFVFLILTASRTAAAAAMLALAVYLAVVCSRRTKLAIACALSIVFCLLLLSLGDALLPSVKNAAMLGRDDSTVDSFNGRTRIWEEVGYYIQRRPILGYGYGGFWTRRHITEVSATEKWAVPEGHSAYLDCLLNLGVVGLLAFVCALLGGVARSFAIHRASQAPAFAFSGAFLIFCVTHGLLESAILLSTLPIFLIASVLIELGFRRAAT
jgi:exopolysaccharide production protein ExoQ